MKNKKNDGPVKWILIIISALFLFVMLILPLIYVAATAFKEGITVFLKAVTDEYARKAMNLTVYVTVVAVIANTIFGIFAAWCLTRYSFKGKKRILALIDLPVTVSPIIVGLMYALAYGRQSALSPLLKSLGIKIIFAVPGIIMATIFVTLPFVAREIIPVLNAKGTAEEEAAALMGASGFRIFREITFPHIKWSFLYGIVLCCARSMGEFGAVSVISGHLRGKTNTMPLYIELLYQGYDFTAAFAASSVLVIMAVIILILRGIFEKRLIET